ncbi:MarR-family transcriptional regulator [Cutibacterium acnes JCM 18909]|nr:MarR-family transcriptional regulator [Cutibacterium acnes JCM 18909]
MSASSPKLIDRSPDPDDRRANVLSLTNRGATLVQKRQ